MEGTNVKMKVCGIMLIAILVLQIFMPIFVYAAETVTLTSNKYSLCLKDAADRKYIKGIKAGEKVEDVLKGVSSTGGSECIIQNKDNTPAQNTDNVYTGMKLKAGIKEYTLIVYGDLNGDGLYSALDLSRVKLMVTNLLPNPSDAELQAADLKHADSNTVTALDVSRMQMLIVGLPFEFSTHDPRTEGIITISANPEAPEKARSVQVTVTWPDDTEGLTKQISKNGGTTFDDVANQNEKTTVFEVTENCTIVARLVDANGSPVKSESKEITNVDPNGPGKLDIKVEADPATGDAKEVEVTVTWPANSDGYKRQITKDGGETWEDVPGNDPTTKFTVTENGNVGARLLDSDGKEVSKKLIEITNIKPMPFKIDKLTHTIANFITIQGETNAVQDYYFSRNNGQNWEPVSGTSEGEYTFTGLTPNSKVTVKMKGVAKDDSEAESNSLEQRTFDLGINLLDKAYKDVDGITVDKENNVITMPNGDKYVLFVTNIGSYDVRYLSSTEGAVQEIADNLDEINRDIATYESTGAKTTEEVLEYIDNIGVEVIDEDDPLEGETDDTNKKYGVYFEENWISVDKGTHEDVYLLQTNGEGKHFVTFNQRFVDYNITVTGQDEEEKTVDKVKALITANPTDSIQQILEKAIVQNILLEENVQKVLGTFTVENGNKYKIFVATDANGNSLNTLTVDKVGYSRESQHSIVGAKILLDLALELKKQRIEWAIEDGDTTAEKVTKIDGKENGEFEDKNGAYKQVVIDYATGLYSIEDAVRGALIDVKMTPELPGASYEVKLDITATYPGGISKIEIVTDAGVIHEQTFTGDNNEEKMTYTVSDSGAYTVRATTKDGKVTTKDIVVVVSSPAEDILAGINPETARNTEKTGKLNGIDAGPIQVILTYDEKAKFTNNDRFQYQIVPYNSKLETQAAPVDTAWEVSPNKDLILDNIKTNSIIYARYWDGTKAYKLRKDIIVANVDIVPPKNFGFDLDSTATSIEITPKLDAEPDEAQDSVGNFAKYGIAGTGDKFAYSLDNVNWISISPDVEDGKMTIYEGLKMGEKYTVRLKTFDNAGNETTSTDVKEISMLIPGDFTIEHKPTEFTKENVKVEVKIPGFEGEDIGIQYQLLPSNTSETNYKSLLVDSDWRFVEENDAEPNTFMVSKNCLVVARLLDQDDQPIPNLMVADKITNIDKLRPIVKEGNWPKLERRASTTDISLKVTSGIIDAPATLENASSGIKEYKFTLEEHQLGQNGVYKYVKVREDVQAGATITYTKSGHNLKENTYYRVRIQAFDKAGNSLKEEGGRETLKVLNPDDTKGPINTENGTRDGGDQNYNNPIIPAGFGWMNTPNANWNDPDGWKNGLVIYDEDDNEFVWVPVDGTDVNFAKLEDTDPQYKDGDPIKDVNGNDLTQKEQIDKYHGFYVSRYELSGERSKLLSKKGNTPAVGFTYNKALECTRTITKVIYRDQVISSLISGTQWDTMLSWIAKEKGSNYISKKYPPVSTTSMPTGEDEDAFVKNIYDLQSNVQELTNEISGDKAIIRSGSFKTDYSMVTRRIDSITKDAKRAVITGIRENNTGLRAVLYIAKDLSDVPTGGDPTIYDTNTGGGHRLTDPDSEPSYDNPVIPPGFKAIETPDASWTGKTPKGWDRGLVIEDVNGNQFVWVPVDGTDVKYEKGQLIWQNGTYIQGITGDEVPLHVTSQEAEDQIKTFKGFYIGRYEAGIEAKNGKNILVSKANVRPITGLKYKKLVEGEPFGAKDYADAMYNTNWVKSGLPSGTAWDTITKWISNEGNPVIGDVTTGNSFNHTFTFSGGYAPVSLEETDNAMGAYTSGNNVTKPYQTPYLLGTGQLDFAKFKNIYDLAGNVWEFSSEYYTTSTGKTTYIARGSDFYRDETETWGIAVREGITDPPGEARNEGGFRVMLYLTKPQINIGDYVTNNCTFNGFSASYRNPIIPAGFAPVNKGTVWGTADGWNNGLVIIDRSGNEFVWVPVDQDKVRYTKWTYRGIEAWQTDGDVITPMLKEWEETESTQIYKFGGFYVARHEISQGDSGTAKSLPDKTSWTSLDWQTAFEKSNEMIQQEEVVTGLITGTQWDTIMSWVATEKGKPAILDDSTSWGNYANSSNGKKGAIAKNIYEMAGGVWEFSSELYDEVGNLPEDQKARIIRGGVNTASGSSAPAAYREKQDNGVSNNGIGFRTVLYITGTIEIEEAEAENGPGLYATKFTGSVNPPSLVRGLTPMKLNGNNKWVKVRTRNVLKNKWFNYSNGKWANAWAPDGTRFVWIPRFAYRVNEIEEKMDVVFLIDTTDKPAAGVEVVRTVDGIENTPRISAERNDEFFVTHPAFISDRSGAYGGWKKELSGFWVAKHEMGAGSDKNGTTQFNEAKNAKNVMFAPYVNGTNAPFPVARKKINTHMAKNSEWGAVAYLSVSKYGSGNGKTFSTSGNPANTSPGKYGVKGMSIGSRVNKPRRFMEYVAAYLRQYQADTFHNIKAIAKSNKWLRQAYVIKDTSSNRAGVYNLTSKFYGDAMAETKGWNDSQPPQTPWGRLQNEIERGIETTHMTPRPLFVRNMSGVSRDGTASNKDLSKDSIFTMTTTCGNSNDLIAYRLILVVNQKDEGLYKKLDRYTTLVNTTNKTKEEKNELKELKEWLRNRGMLRN